MLLTGHSPKGKGKPPSGELGTAHNMRSVAARTAWEHWAHALPKERRQSAPLPGPPSHAVPFVPPKHTSAVSRATL